MPHTSDYTSETSSIGPIPPVGRAPRPKLPSTDGLSRRRRRTSAAARAKSPLPTEIQRLQGLFGKVDPTTGKMVTVGTIGQTVRDLGQTRTAQPVGVGGPLGPKAPIRSTQPVGGGVPFGPGFTPPTRIGQPVSTGVVSDPYRIALERRAKRGASPTSPTDLRAKAQSLRANL